jgi:fructokinase
MDGADSVIDAVADASPSGFAPRVFFFDRVSRGALMLAQAFAAQGAVVVFEPVGVGDPKLFVEALATTHILKYSNERLPDLAARQPAGRRLLLEIETMGSAGLRYRSSLLQTRSWYQLDAVPTRTVLDTAGAGDWCTAGLLAMIATNGVADVQQARARDIAAALRFGQVAASIACGYEGARGAMTALDRRTFDRTAAAILAGERPAAEEASLKSGARERTADAASQRTVRTPDRVAVGEVCPACP